MFVAYHESCSSYYRVSKLMAATLIVANVPGDSLSLTFSTVSDNYEIKNQLRPATASMPNVPGRSPPSTSSTVSNGYSLPTTAIATANNRPSCLVDGTKSSSPVNKPR